MKSLRLVLRTLRLAMTRIGPGWMFGLLTLNFNRITVHELGALAVIVTTLIGLHHFLSPLQVWFGHLADRYPIAGYRRSPFIILSSLVAALVFLTLPWLAVQLGESSQTLIGLIGGNPASPAGSPLGALLMIALAFGLFVLFGVAIAANGSSANALVAEAFEEKHRGPAFVLVWLCMIFTSIVSAGIAKQIMPDQYDPQHMQVLYNLTLPIVLITTLAGLIGIEHRVSREEHRAMMARKRVETSSGQAFGVFWQLLRANPHVRAFFLFLLLAMLGIFLQDAILEVFGAEVFHMTQKETASFTQYWGGGMLAGIVLVAILARLKSIPRKAIATIGGMGVALSLITLALSAARSEQSLVAPALFLLGVWTGLFNVGALSLMMDMTVEGHTGIYMGMWGLAQGLGIGLANVFSGVLHTALIETSLLPLTSAYSFIYSLEAAVMILAILVLRRLNVQDFKGLSGGDVQRTMALDTAT